MSSRAAPSVRRDPEKDRYRRPIEGRDPAVNAVTRSDTRKVVCKRCGLVMSDCEDFAEHGEFWHIAKPHQTRAAKCINSGMRLDLRHAEVVPFMRKRDRRRLRRNNIRA